MCIGDASAREPLTVRPQTPRLPAERERIVGLGGLVSRGRVHGILAVSRALGDLELQPFVTPEPQVTAGSVDF